MDPKIIEYVKSKRDAGMADDQIEANLIASGWQVELAKAALKANLEAGDVPPPPPVPSPTVLPSVHPVAVVQNFTTKGLEYVIMFISLWISASAVGFLLHEAVSAAFSSGQDYLSGIVPFSTASLVVALPIFSILFFRLKKAENEDPSIKSDPSRKKAVQLTLVVTFLIGLGHIISYVYSLLNFGSTDYSNGSQSAIANLLHTFITLGIAGGIFIYYWIDEHRKAE